MVRLWNYLAHLSFTTLDKPLTVLMIFFSDYAFTYFFLGPPTFLSVPLKFLRIHAFSYENRPTDFAYEINFTKKKNVFTV